MDSTQKISKETFALLAKEQFRVVEAGEKRPTFKSLIGEAVAKAFTGKSKKK